MSRPKPMTDAQILHWLDRLIIGMKADKELDDEQKQALNALRVIAVEYRAREPSAIEAALTELTRRHNAIHDSKTALGYSQTHLIAMGNEVVSRWAVIRQALEDSLNAAMMEQEQ